MSQIGLLLLLHECHLVVLKSLHSWCYSRFMSPALLQLIHLQVPNMGNLAHAGNMANIEVSSSKQSCDAP